KEGASLTGVTVIVKLCGALVSTPPFAVPPSSWRSTVMVALPKALAAGVKESVPVGETAGPAPKRAAFVLPVTWKATVWLASLGPGERAVAHDWLGAPLSSSPVTLPPRVKDGASLTWVTVIVAVVPVLRPPPLASVAPWTTNEKVVPGL